MLWVCLALAKTREFLLGIKINKIELNTGKNLQEKLVQSAVQQTLGDKITFQQDKNLKDKAK